MTTYDTMFQTKQTSDRFIIFQCFCCTPYCMFIIQHYPLSYEPHHEKKTIFFACAKAKTPLSLLHGYYNSSSTFTQNFKILAFVCDCFSSVTAQTGLCRTW